MLNGVVYLKAEMGVCNGWRLQAESKVLTGEGELSEHELVQRNNRNSCKRGIRKLHCYIEQIRNP